VKHVLKTWPEYFTAIRNGKKTWEFRKHDRTFKSGDDLVLMEWCPVAKEYTGEVEKRRVTYVASGGLIPEGFCVMSVVHLAECGANR
jgi:hypothetical protein